MKVFGISLLVFFWYIGIIVVGIALLFALYNYLTEEV